MGFKENLKFELDCKDIQVKELAMMTGINRRTLDNYLRKKESQPTVENAVKIAKALGVSVEFLVTGNDTTIQTQRTHPDFDIYRKYRAVVLELDKLSPTMLTFITTIIHTAVDFSKV